MTGAAAGRLRIRRWRDPRLLIGVMLVLASTILGARVVAASDDTTEYWALNASVAAGDPVTRDALVPTRLRLSTSVEGNYVRTDEEFPAPLEQLVWNRDIATGALVDRASMVPSVAKARSQLPLSVAAGAAPADLSRGDLVDVWVGPGPGDETGSKAVRVLGAVRIVHAGGDSASLGGSLAQTVLVDVGENPLEGSVVATVASGHVTLVRVS